MDSDKIDNIVITKDFINTGEALVSKEFLVCSHCILTIDKDSDPISITLTHVENIEWGEEIFTGTLEQCQKVLAMIHDEVQSYRKYLRSRSNAGFYA